jgi:type II secretory pathway component GspD/PulD (secretin)
VSTRAPHTLFLALAAALACADCRSNPAEGSEKSGAQISRESLDELIAKGALRPVDAMDETKKPPEPPPDADAQAYERAVAKLKGSREAEPPPASASSGSAPAAPGPAAPAAPAPGAQAPAPQTPAPQVPGSGAPAAPPRPGLGENPYLVFGKRIQVFPETGLIMKPYPLRVGSGKQMLQLLQTYGNFPLWQPGGAAQTSDQVRLELLEKLDQELFSDLRKNPPVGEPAPISVADWLVVTASAPRLEEVESFLNIFAAGVPQIEIEAKIVEVTLTNQLDLGVTPVDSSTPIFGFPSGGFVKSLNYNLPNTSGPINGLLTIGAVQDGVHFNAVLQALASFENVSIISRPTIAVREGGRAAIENTVRIPTYAVSGITASGQFAANLNYEEVGIKLYVVPRVVGTQTVALNIDIEASAQSGTSVTFTVPPATGSPGFTLSNPTLSKRAAQTVVYLQPGQAVILGGLISERTVDEEQKLPLLGDIPLLGYLFKSTLKRKEQTNVLFFLRPRILQGTDLNREF